MCSKNKGDDQLCSYCEADMRLFLQMQLVGFLMTWLIYYTLAPIVSIIIYRYMVPFK